MQGPPFFYSLGETSAGIISLGWYVLCVVCYWVLSRFHALLGFLAPLTVDNRTTAQSAGHLYLAAYLPGTICLIATALGVRRLAYYALPASAKNRGAHSLFCWLLGAVAAVDAGLLWGTMSGLEVPFASALAVWSVCALLGDVGQGRLR